jgi:tRNA pseudouridine55 synthase
VRQGEQVELAPRAVTIQRLELLGWDSATARLELLVRCSAGTYIRSLARDLGEALGCGGALAQLRRSEALGFSLAQAVPLEHLDQAPLPALLDPLAALAHLPRRGLDEAELAGWRCGRALAATPSPAPLETGPPLAAGQPVAVVAPDGNLAGMARASGSGLLEPKLVFNATG